MARKVFDLIWMIHRLFFSSAQGQQATSEPLPQRLSLPSHSHKRSHARAELMLRAIEAKEWKNLVSQHAREGP
jgi:hypothetical protein